MTSKPIFRDRIRFEPVIVARDECMTTMRNKSWHMTTLHCQPEWDNISKMCWAPTPAGESAMIPCPDDGFLNPNEFATRICLPSGHWFINHTFDNKPYTNFEDCLRPPDPTTEDDLKKLVDTKVIFILKSLDEYKREYIILHVVSIVLLVAAIIVCAIGVLKSRQRNHFNLSCIILTTTAAALLINNAVTVSVNAVDDATRVIKCRAAKWLVLTSTLVFYECFLGHISMCIVPILRINIKPLFIKISIAAMITLTVVLVTTELLLETLSCPTRYCGFSTLQSSFHWLTTTPKLLLIMIHMCLGSVIAFGVLFLKQPHLAKGGELCHIRQKIISALVLVLYNIILETLLVLIHTEAYMSYSDLPVDQYLSAFSFATAAHGAVFTVVMCFSDAGLLTMLRISLKCAQLENKSRERADKAVQMPPVSYCPSNSDNTRDIEHPDFPHVGVGLSQPENVDIVCHWRRSEDPNSNMYQSKLFYGVIK